MGLDVLEVILVALFQFPLHWWIKSGVHSQGGTEPHSDHRVPGVRVPQPTVTWSINDSPLTPKDRIRLLDNNRQLTIDQAQVADTAVYMCVAVNKAGELRKKFQLEVLGMGN